MTGLDIAHVVKAELTKLHLELSQKQRRRAVLEMAARKLRMGYAPEVVLAEIRAAGEDLADLPPAEEWQR